MAIILTVNGESRSLDVEPEKPLLWALREDLHLTGPKFGCGLGQCGACTVQLNGAAVRSCLLPVGALAGASVDTIEGLTRSGALKSLQDAWIAEQAQQCGYCIPGFIVAAHSLLRQTPQPTDAEIDAAITNICRCGGYLRAKAAIRRAANATGAAL
ncbi:MAG: (2Fe-2S)-binding protein [Alphaproteobacteria bacterium]|nr:(2Fe-2S)-binding protein [Alphaproteobacteria bacterium]